MRETDPDMQKTSPWLIAARVIFTFALIACIVFIFSNSMQIGDVSETASGRVLLLMKKVFTRLGMPGVANHLTDHIVRKLAHFCEYALEGFLLTLCLRVYTRRFFVHISWPILGTDKFSINLPPFRVQSTVILPYKVSYVAFTKLKSPTGFGAITKCRYPGRAPVR